MALSAGGGVTWEEATGAAGRDRFRNNFYIQGQLEQDPSEPRQRMSVFELCARLYQESVSKD